MVLLLLLLSTLVAAVTLPSQLVTGQEKVWPPCQAGVRQEDSLILPCHVGRQAGRHKSSWLRKNNKIVFLVGTHHYNHSLLLFCFFTLLICYSFILSFFLSSCHSTSLLITQLGFYFDFEQARVTS